QIIATAALLWIPIERLPLSAVVAHDKPRHESAKYGCKCNCQEEGSCRPAVGQVSASQSSPQAVTTSISGSGKRSLPPERKDSLSRAMRFDLKCHGKTRK